MADNKRKRDPQFTSPIGTFRFPKLTEPDYGTEKYPAPDGFYAVQLVLKQNDPDTKKFLDALRPHYNEAIAAGEDAFKQLPVANRKKLGQLTQGALYDDVYDKDTEQPTGEIVFKFKLKAGGTYKKGPKAGQRWSARPIVVDAQGQRVPADVAIWGGTKGRVSFTVSPYFVASDGKAGLSTRLLGAQIVELVTAGERSAESLGFGVVDGGYAAAPAVAHDDVADSDDTGLDDEIPF